MKACTSLLFLLLIFTACQKPKQNYKTIYAFPKKPDKILYHSGSPDQRICSVRSFTPNPDPEGSDSYPVPYDSTALIMLDMTGDSNADFLIFAEHSILNRPCSVHDPSVYYSIKITSVDPNDSISIQDGSVADIRQAYDTTDVFPGTTHYSQSVFLYYQMVGCQGLFSCPMDDMYIAVKIWHYNGWIHLARVPNNGVVVWEYALNLTEGNVIRVGQKR